MRSLILVASPLPIALTLALVACGSSVTSAPDGLGGAAASADATTASETVATTGTSVGTTGSSTAATSSSVGAGTGGGGASGSFGDCTTDADCSGEPCVALTAGGYKVCLSSVSEATMCHPPGQPIMDQCCTSADCKVGKCYSSDAVAHCSGGPVMLIYNSCIADTCTSDADCTGPTPSLCAPAGAFGYPARQCMTAYCHTNTDCPAEANGGGVPAGICEPVRGSCCDLPLGLACVRSDGCKGPNDCKGSTQCEIVPAEKGGVCIAGMATCPV